MIHGFNVVLCDLKPRVGSYCLLGVVGMIQWGPGGLGCDLD